MTPNKPLTWDQIPDSIHRVCKRWTFSREQHIEVANEIMDAMKPELEKAWKDRAVEVTNPLSGKSWEMLRTDIDFETWYNQTYNLCQLKK